MILKEGINLKWLISSFLYKGKSFVGIKRTINPLTHLASMPYTIFSEKY